MSQTSSNYSKNNLAIRITINQLCERIWKIVNQNKQSNNAKIKIIIDKVNIGR